MNRILRSAVIGIAVATAIPVNIDAIEIQMSREISSNGVEGEEEPEKEEEVNTEQDGIEAGKSSGEALGGEHARSHFANNLGFNSERDRLTDSQIIEKYKLDEKGEAYKRGFLSVFNSVYTEAYTVTYTELSGDSGRSKGRLEAQKLAVRHAEEHFHTNTPADPTRSLLTDQELIARYYLNFRDEDYRNAFIESFKESYVGAYIDEYINLGEQNNTNQYERAREDGSRLGELMGSSHAMIDFSKRERNNWEESLARMEAVQTIESRYALDKEEDEYARVFSRWFKSAFGSSYTERYRELNLEVGVENIEYREITGFGDVITLENIVGEISDGIGSTSRVSAVSLEIPEAAFYKRTYVGISRHKDTFGSNPKGYYRATDIHTISVSNQSGDVSLRGDLTLSFDFIGTERVGIYEYLDGKWIYLPTEQEEGLVTTKIPKGIEYSGGHYALFIDDEYSHFEDIQDNWAREEIYSYLRRGYVIGYGDDTFRPERELTRLEFLILTSRVLEWDYEGEWYQGGFRDSHTFKGYTELINYSARLGYVTGYEDGYFRPNRNISYREIEFLMSRIIGDRDFKWSSFADKIKHDKYEYSNSYTSMHKHISRAEAIYMLYELEKSGRI